MLKRILAAMTAAFTLVLGLGLASAPASAAGFDDLTIGTIAYNAVGSDTYVNRNAEYVDIRNSGADPVNVQGLVVEDSWRHGQGDNYRGQCNRLTVTTLPGVDGTTTTVLPAGHVLRVYTGTGPSKVFSRGDLTIHPVYMDSPDRCGYHGHVWNNSAPSVRTAPWDVVYVSLAGVTKSKPYQFWPSYYVS